MTPLPPLYLSTLCMFLSIAPVTWASQNTTGTTKSITSMKAINDSDVVRTNGAERTYSPTFPTIASTTSVTDKTPPKNEHRVVEEHKSTSPKTTSPKTTSPKTTSPKTTFPHLAQQKSSTGTAVALLLLFLLLIILVIIMLRWYRNNPDRRSFRGLWASIVETAQWAWVTVMAFLQRPRKQPEEVEGEENEAVVVEMEKQDGSEEEKMEGDTKAEGERKEEDDTSSESDDSAEDYSFVDGANLAEEEKQNEGEGVAGRSAKEDTEEMTSVKLDEEEDVEKAEPEEGDDLTPL